jgi:adenine phosphoribosyltransferase
MELKNYIRDVPDFPSPGILFRDITPLLSDQAAFRYAIDLMAERYENSGIDAVVAIDARGFLFGAPLAYRLGKGLVPVRKAGKLPFHSLQVAYSLEYGENVVEMHRDAVAPGQTVLVVDDLLATGGTIRAAAQLVEQVGGTVASIAAVIELVDLNGREKLQGYDVFALMQY